MKEAIFETLEYFVFFNYPPTLEELWMYLGKKIAKKKLGEVVSNLVQQKKVIVNQHGTRITLVGYSSLFAIHAKRKHISEQKKKKIALFIRLLSYFPWIQLVGYSGSVAMSNAVESDDIDLFIVTKSQRMWTARFFAVVVAWLLGIKRPRSVTHSVDTVCLNLFFDERDMHIPIIKQTAYVAHELLQMKVIFQKSRTYVHLLMSNKWVFSIFPNASVALMEQTSVKEVGIESVSTTSSFILLGQIGERLLKGFQLAIMKKPRTKERIGNTQLWFFPDDFEDKLHQYK